MACDVNTYGGLSSFLARNSYSPDVHPFDLGSKVTLKRHERDKGESQSLVMPVWFPRTKMQASAKPF